MLWRITEAAGGRIGAPPCCTAHVSKWPNAAVHGNSARCPQWTRSRRSGDAVNPAGPDPFQKAASSGYDGLFLGCARQQFFGGGRVARNATALQQHQRQNMLPAAIFLV